MDAERVRFLAISALGGFETLDHDDAVEGAICDLLEVLRHVADDPVAIALIGRIEERIDRERVVSVLTERSARGRMARGTRFGASGTTRRDTLQTL